jgi:hypothetical protein
VIRLSLFLLPLAFVVGSWLWADGIPYYTDANETFASFVHARNMVTWAPWKTAWLTVETTDPTHPVATNLYTHNPNGPRYAHYLLFLVGITDLRLHILLLSVAGALLTSWLCWRFWQSALPCRSALWGVAPLALFLDPIGCLYWLVNTYRLWTFVLYFACLWAVAAKRPLWTGLTTFLLFQYEYGTALFIGTTMTVLATLRWRWGSVPLVAASFVGAVLSLAVFAVQVWYVFGWDWLLLELSGTALRRGSPNVEPGLGAALRHAVTGLWLVWDWARSVAYSPPIAALIPYGPLSAPVALALSRCPARRLLAILSLACWSAAFVSAALLWGYFEGGFIGSSLPMAVFLVGPSLAALALDAGRVPRVSLPMAGAVLLGLLCVSGTVRFRAPVDATVYRLLSDEYRGRSLVAPDPLMLTVTALTGGPAIPSGGIWITPEQRERVNRSREASGELRYVCVSPNVARFGDLTVGKDGKILDPCQEAVTRMVWQGDEVERYGLGWVIMRVAR